MMCLPKNVNDSSAVGCAFPGFIPVVVEGRAGTWRVWLWLGERGWGFSGPGAP